MHSTVYFLLRARFNDDVDHGTNALSPLGNLSLIKNGVVNLEALLVSIPDRLSIFIRGVKGHCI